MLYLPMKIFARLGCQIPLHAGLLFDDEGKRLISSGDKHIRVFHNVPGLRRNLQDFQAELKVAKSEGLKTRLTDQISTLKETLNSVEP